MMNFKFADYGNQKMSEMPIQYFPVRLSSSARERFKFLNGSDNRHRVEENIIKAVQSTVMPLSNWVANHTVENKPKKRLYKPIIQKDKLIKINAKRRADYAQRIKSQQSESAIKKAAELKAINDHCLTMSLELKGETARTKKIAVEMPRGINEKAFDYAKRIVGTYPELTCNELSKVSSMQTHRLIRSNILKITSEAVKAQQETPREPGETNISYAKRLRIEQPHFETPVYSYFSGVNNCNLKKITMFNPLSQSIIRVGQDVKRLCNEDNNEYAQRVWNSYPDFPYIDCLILTGVCDKVIQRSMHSPKLLRGFKKDELFKLKPSMQILNRQLDIALKIELHDNDWRIIDEIMNGIE